MAVSYHTVTRSYHTLTGSHGTGAFPRVTDVLGWLPTVLRVHGRSVVEQWQRHERELFFRCRGDLHVTARHRVFRTSVPGRGDSLSLCSQVYTLFPKGTMLFSLLQPSATCFASNVALCYLLHNVFSATNLCSPSQIYCIGLSVAWALFPTTSLCSQTYPIATVTPPCSLLYPSDPCITSLSAATLCSLL